MESCCEYSWTNLCISFVTLYYLVNFIVDHWVSTKEKKNVLVTGCDSGFGLQTALELSKCNWLLSRIEVGIFSFFQVQEYSIVRGLKYDSGEKPQKHKKGFCGQAKFPNLNLAGVEYFHNIQSFACRTKIFTSAIS